MGGMGLKLVERIFSYKEKTMELGYSEAESIRGELRHEVETLRKDLYNVGRQLDEWKGKYFDLRSKFVELESRYNLLRLEMDLLIRKSAEESEDE
jgi:hypothetical protein